MPRYAELSLLLLLAASATAASVFDGEGVFEIQLAFDFDAICMNPERNDCDDVPGVITYMSANGESRDVNVNIRTRGRWNPKTAGCQLPSLFVYFDEQTAKGTLFEEESMLPLTTHCRHHNRAYGDLVQIEYLAHRIFTMLTDVSLRTRLLSVTYKDTRSSRARRRSAFLIEHFDKLGERTGTTWRDTDKVDLDKVRPEEMARLSLFQYMIGNLDWSAIQPHNVAMFEDAAGFLTPVPFDFDYSGIVSTPYASPPSELPVYSVRQRFYRGLCWPDFDWDALFDEFLAIENDVYAELASLSNVNFKERRRVRHFLKDFFRTIRTEKSRQSKIIDRCRVLPRQAGSPVAGDGGDQSQADEGRAAEEPAAPLDSQ
ncbi:MAG: hypothetical protein QNJ07_01745 [Woeseiaceae bacterium]|nr:hypothetical protein [Woeseiaceae bacterium]